MKVKQVVRVLASCGVIGLSLAATNIFAAGYRMEFQSASVLADAGEAAVAEDAGTNWYNAAALTMVPRQVVVSAIDVYAPTTFSGSVTGGSAFGPAFTFNANGSASSHPNSLVPAIHYNVPLSQKLSFGLSFVPAWGFVENYGEGSLVRYDLTRVYTKTIDISPSIAYQINKQWSIALGPDFHYFAVETKFHVFTQGAPVGFATLNDSIARYSANNWGYGYHAGVLFQLDNATRFGLSYRSQLIMGLSGYSDFVLGNNIANFEADNFQVNIPLPPVTTLSAYRDINSRWAVMGTVMYDQWSILGNYHASNYVTPAGTLPTVIQQQNMSNTFSFSAGAHYKLSEDWMFRGSLKYMPTPTNNAFRDVNFPDGAKLGLHIGTRYQMTKTTALDLIYGHAFVRTASIHGVYPPQVYPATVATNGHSRTSIDFFGGQIVWNV